MAFKQPNTRNYYASFVIGGKRVRRSLGTPNKAEAERIEKQVRAEIKSDKHYWDKMMAEYLDATGYERAKPAIENMRPWFGGRTYESLGPVDITRFEQGRRKQGAAPGTIRKELSIFRSAVIHAREKLGWPIVNILRGRIPKAGPPKIRWLTKAEYEKLIAAVDVKARDYLPDIITLACYTGLRLSELMNLKWSQVDLESRTIYLNPSQQKSNKYSSLPLARQAVEALTQRNISKGDNDMVFHIKSPKKAFATAVRKSGIEHCRFHDLRHTYAAWLLQAGVGLRELQDLMRHSDIGSTMIYSHLTQDATRRAVERL